MRDGIGDTSGHHGWVERGGASGILIRDAWPWRKRARRAWAWRATLRTIKQNLFWAFFYNGLEVPLEMLGCMIPVLCAGCASGSCRGGKL